MIRLAPAALALVALTATSGCTLLRGGSTSSAGTTATATLVDPQGTTIGTVSLAETATGVLLTGSVRGIGVGTHGIHLHETGACTPSFAAAGGHFNPTARQHGFRNPAGHHVGDMPNLHVTSTGTHTFDITAPGARLRGDAGLLEGDGTAIVIHANADDYLTDPSGNSGDRIACGVIVAR